LAIVRYAWGDIWDITGGAGEREKGGRDGRRETFGQEVKKKDTASEQLSTTLSSSAHTKIDSLTHTMDNYPTPNRELIKTLNLQRHPENGYFVETDRQPHSIPSPFAGESNGISGKRKKY
jgi:hypothetical protein